MLNDICLVGDSHIIFSVCIRIIAIHTFEHNLKYSKLGIE